MSICCEGFVWIGCWIEFVGKESKCNVIGGVFICIFYVNVNRGECVSVWEFIVVFG